MRLFAVVLVVLAVEEVSCIAFHFLWNGTKYNHNWYNSTSNNNTKPADLLNSGCIT